MTYPIEKLEELGVFQAGMIGTKEKLEAGGEPVSAVEISGLKSGQVAWEKLRVFHPTGKLDAYVVQEGDLIITLRPPIRAVQIHIQPSYQTETLPPKAIAVGAVIIFRCDKAKATNGYISWAIEQLVPVRNLVRQSANSTLKFYRLKDLRSMEIPVPPLAIQNKIARVWKLKQQLLDLERARLQATEEYAQSLGHYLINAIPNQPTSSRATHS